MKQLFGTAEGTVVIKEMPAPELRGTGAILQPKYSAISTGTESTMLRLWRAGHEAETKDLRLGYSTVGVVLESSPGLEGIRPGDLAAGAGIGFASHAQLCYVPKNLLSPCPAGVDLRQAAFTTLGACAMQGVRRGRVELGETVAIIGLGMLGQLAVQIAKAAGARVIAIDPLEARLKLAAQGGADVTLTVAAASQGVREATDGRGVDAAILTAGSPTSSAPLVQGLELTRDRGRVVVVGNMKCEFPRELWYYKDIELLISRSYGPGRYDSEYEEGGHDYPPGFVRWTEGRNLREFIRLLGAGRVNVTPLITHEVPFERAPEMYELLLAKPGECLGVLLKY